MYYVSIHVSLFVYEYSTIHLVIFSSYMIMHDFSNKKKKETDRPTDSICLAM